MYQLALFIHILGWAQWMTGQTALTGMLRKEVLYKGTGGTGPSVSTALKPLFATLFVGAAMAVGGGIWLLMLNPGLAKMGFVHVKLLIALCLLFVALLPVRMAYNGLSEEDGEPLGSVWFVVSLLGFVCLIGLGVFKPF